MARRWKALDSDRSGNLGAAGAGRSRMEDTCSQPNNLHAEDGDRQLDRDRGRMLAEERTSDAFEIKWESCLA